MLSLTLTGYMALIAAPEPVSKGVAAALTVLLWGYLGWELFDLLRAYFQLWEEAAESSTFAELHEAGKRFGKVIGPNSMRILLLLGTAAVGETAALVSKAPKLPGFAKAVGSIKSQAGVRDVLTAVQEADRVKVAVSEGTFSVVLPANAVSMAARGTRGLIHRRTTRKSMNGWTEQQQPARTPRNVGPRSSMNSESWPENSPTRTPRFTISSPKALRVKDWRYVEAVL